MHIALLGDSIFDNAFYTQGGPDVAAQLRALLPRHKVTLLAVDGAVCDEMGEQIERIPSDATHLFLSAGGNDAIMASDVLLRPVSTVGEGVYMLADEAERFETRHARLLDALVAKSLPLVVGTVYNPRFSDALQQRVSVAALCLFNDAIIRGACKRGLPLLDLRAICVEHDDYANDIEPSSQGALKIARVMQSVLENHDFSARRTTIYASTTG